MSTDVQKMLEDLDGGVFISKLSRVLSDVAAAVTDHGKAGNVTIKLDMKQLGSGAQVMLGHSLSFTRPTSRGEATEKEKTETPMYVGGAGALTLMPENQQDLFHSES